MPDSTQDTCTIDFPTRIDSVTGGLSISFYRGLKARLRDDHAEHDIILRTVNYSHAHHYMVGVAVNPEGNVVDLRHAAESHVHSVREDEEEAPNRLEVALWANSPVCYLRKDHADFERIRRTLEEAMISGDSVWYATYSDPEEVEAKNETWIGMRIMDIRPVLPDTARGQAKMKAPQGITLPTRTNNPNGASATPEAAKAGS
jgi:hypothetical protein